MDVFRHHSTQQGPTRPHLAVTCCFMLCLNPPPSNLCSPHTEILRQSEKLNASMCSLLFSSDVIWQFSFESKVKANLFNSPVNQQNSCMLAGLTDTSTPAGCHGGVSPFDPNRGRAGLGPKNHMTGSSRKPPNVTLLKVTFCEERSQPWYSLEI